MRLHTRSVFTLLLFFGLLAAAVPVAARNAPASEGGGCVNAQIDPDGVWHCFDWGAGQPVDADQTFTTNHPAPFQLQITDCFCTGDVFEVRIDGDLVLTTSPSVPDPDCSDAAGEGGGGGDDADICWADPAYSKGEVGVAAGPHTVTIRVIENPFDSGAAFIRGAPGSVVTIPTAGGVGLAVLALLLLIGSLTLLARRRVAGRQGA